MEGTEMMKEIVHELISKQEAEKRIGELSKKINEDYEGKEVHLLCILKGSVFFFTELAKQLTMPVTIDFMAVSSYQDGTISSGTLDVRKDLDEEIAGKHCIIVEDIIDSGNTLSMTKKMLLEREPASLRICTLLDKPERRETEVEVEYTGFVIPDKFVVGYGLDYAQKYRNLQYIGELEFVEE